MPTKSAKVCALPKRKFFARLPDAQWYPPQWANSALKYPNAQEVAKNDRSGAKKISP
jgi:hypothetical protein